jgi:hypothetical protein
MPVAHNYTLGKDCVTNYGVSGALINNKDIKTVNFSWETAAEADVTTRGSDVVQEFVPVRRNSTVEVVCLDHNCVMHCTGILSVAGSTGAAVTGIYYVSNLSIPQEIDGAVEYTVQLKRFVGV